VLVPAEPELSKDDRRALAKAVSQFNHGRFFACHETQAFLVKCFQ